MSQAAGEMTYDLAKAAVDEAMEAVKRKALLMPAPERQPLVVLVAAALLEGKCRSIRSMLAGFAGPELNEELGRIVGMVDAAETKASSEKLLREVGELLRPRGASSL